MIECPQCHAKLPDWVETCQFCQGDTRLAARPLLGSDTYTRSNPHAFETPKWVWGAYYALAGYYVLNGGWEIANGVISYGKLESFFRIFAVFVIVIGAISVLLGIGLAARVEAARGIVNVFCGIKILFGLMALGGNVLGAAVAGPLAILMMLLNVIDIAVAGFTIYLIGETDKYGFR